MVVYICETCKKEFNKKSNYINHIENKKKPCLQQKLILHQKTPKCTEKSPKCTNNIVKYTEKSVFSIQNIKQKEYNNTNKDYICNFCQISLPLQRFNNAMHY